MLEIILITTNTESRVNSPGHLEQGPSIDHMFCTVCTMFLLIAFLLSEINI